MRYSNIPRHCHQTRGSEKPTPRSSRQFKCDESHVRPFTWAEVVGKTNRALEHEEGPPTDLTACRRHPRCGIDYVSKRRLSQPPGMWEHNLNPASSILGQCQNNQSINRIHNFSDKSMISENRRGALTEPRDNVWKEAEPDLIRSTN